MRGLHLTADLYQCTCEHTVLTDEQVLAEKCRDAVRAADLTCVADRYFTFDGAAGDAGGVTAALLLMESHLALHTWPEHGFVSIDVYVCNYSTDNSAKAEQLLQAMTALFRPGQVERNRLVRGVTPAGNEVPEYRYEWLGKDAFFGLASTRTLVSRNSGLQKLDLVETPQFGKLLRLDDANMTSVADEFFYHEALVHPAATAHEAPGKALIIGGGDGGAAEELLKHPSLAEVVLVELDPEVVALSRQHLAEVHRGVFDDARLRLVHEDGGRFIAESKERFDLVFLDLTDPETPARALYQPDFFAALKDSLAPGGAISMHIGSPVFHQERFARLVRELKKVFAEVHPYSLYIPVYGTQWGMAVASETLNPRRLASAAADERIAERGLEGLSYYNGDVHQALFALPNYVRELLAGG